MHRIQKTEYRTPDISFFVPSLADQFEDPVSNQAKADVQQSRWQPRWTIWFSLGAGLGLWAAIIWLIRL
jgi:hypothetical protein